MNRTFVMKAQELRIGNWVKWVFPNRNNQPNKIKDCQVQSIGGLVGVLDSAYGYDQIEPIPLTEQWLIDFGFEAYGSRGFVSKEAFSPGHPSQRFDIDWSKKTGTMCKSRYQEDNDCFTMRHIKHVHQLQNLYFALTGEDLHL